MAVDISRSSDGLETGVFVCFLALHSEVDFVKKTRLTRRDAHGNYLHEKVTR